MVAKAYWFANNDVHDWDGMARYRDANREVMTRYGAKFIVMGGNREVIEGPDDSARSSFTIVEFPSREAAVACYRDPEYVAAAALRHQAADGWAVIVEGYDGPQDFGGQIHRNESVGT